MEGPDFSGKSTLVSNLKPLLADLDPPVYFTREPGGTPAAERIREVLLDPDIELDDWTEAYLYAAARADHVRREILPRLERGETVFCERFLDSSLAYQGYARGLGAKVVRELNARAVGNVLPDKTFYLRLGPEERERRAENSGNLDRIEVTGKEFMDLVFAGFEELAGVEPNRIEILDATLPPDQLAEAVRSSVLKLRYTPANGRD